MIQLLIEQKQSFNEAQLLRQLCESNQAIFQSSLFSDDLALFQSHFILFNALHRLNNTGQDSATFSIEIDPSNIVAHFYQETSTDTEIKSFSKVDSIMRDYYLDWQNYDKTNKEDVEELLNNFWQKFSFMPTEPKDITAQLQRMGFAELPNKIELKKSFKALSLKYHPDKGGDQTQFQQLLVDYQTIKNAM